MLTEKSSRQLIEDRRDYGGMLQTKVELEAQKTQEEAKQQKKMEELCEASNEAAMAVGNGSHEFLAAQKQNIVEIVNYIDFSNQINNLI